ncbi:MULTISPECIES: hypothetical protein [unclassified Bartonella]
MIKKSLACMIKVMGAVTSPTGAVICGIIHCLSDHFSLSLLL